MSERKVLNKYYPPDFDPSKIPRMKLPKNRQYTVRLMAPFNMRCVTCGEYIYKGKKFNARKEDVEGEDYLGIRIYRFYIKCTRCLQEISFKTDPRNTDYEIEAGATRNFMALKLAEEQAQREEDERREDEATNPMKLLENRTKQSKQELELLESLEELRDLNRRQRTVDYDSMLSQFDTKDLQKKLEEQQEAEDEEFIRSVFGNCKSNKRVLEEEIIENVDNEEALIGKSSRSVVLSGEPLSKVAKTTTSSLDVPPVFSTAASSSVKPLDFSWKRSVGALPPKKSTLTSLVRLKKTAEGEQTVSSTEKATSSAPSAEKATSSAPSTQKVTSSAPSAEKVTSSAPSALSLLGSYSDTDSDET